jgi:hypothetical protein
MSGNTNGDGDVNGADVKIVAANGYFVKNNNGLPYVPTP